MEEKWYQSRRMWSSALAVVGLVLTMFGYTGFDPSAQAALIDAVMTVVKDISAISAPLLAIWSWFKPKPTPPAV